VHRHFICLAAGLTITLGSFTVGRAEILGDYLSVESCVECHEEEVAGWKETPHAHAFETLKEQGEEKQSAQGCVKCHVVGFEKDGGFIDMELTPELKDVQCEACHGPGRRHAESEDPADILGKPDAVLCRSCHTEGQDKNFDYETKKMWVHGGSGESVKVAAVSEPALGNLTISQCQIEFGNMVEGEVAKKKHSIVEHGKSAAESNQCHHQLSVHHDRAGSARIKTWRVDESYD
jgi:hypothetical protein